MDTSQRSRHATARGSAKLFDDMVAQAGSFSKWDINGEFRVTITLRHMWLKSSAPTHKTFSLSYFYPPLGIMEIPVICKARPDPSIDCGDPNIIYSIICCGSWSEVVSGSQILAISRQPILKIEMGYYEDRAKGLPHFAFAEVPIGDIFRQIQMASESCCSELNGNANLTKVKSNRELGQVEFTVKVERLPERKTWRSRAITMNKNMNGFCISVHLSKTKGVRCEFEAQKTLHNKMGLEFVIKVKNKRKEVVRKLFRSSPIKAMQSEESSNMRPIQTYKSTENKRLERLNRTTTDSTILAGSMFKKNISLPHFDLNLHTQIQLVESSCKQPQNDFTRHEIERLVKARNELLTIYTQSDVIIQGINQRLEILSRRL